MTKKVIKPKYEYIKEFKVFGVEDGVYNYCITKVEREDINRVREMLDQLAEWGIFEYNASLGVFEEEFEEAKNV